MSSLPARPELVGRSGLRGAILAGLAALLVAGCAGSGPGSPPVASSGTAASSGAVASAGAAGASASAGAVAATPVGSQPAASGAAGSGGVGAASPPPVAITLPAGGTVQGLLGGYTWRGKGSDAPWIVPPAALAVRAGGPFTAALDPSIGVGAWVARWAPIDGETVGDVAGYEQGTGRPMVFSGPTAPGPWGLSLDITFSDGGRASWYWRLEPHA